MTEVAHSKIGASSMYRWSACPGSVKLSEGIERTESEYAKEGTRAHELAAQWLDKVNREKQDELIELIESMGPEVTEAIEVYVDTVLADAGSNKIFIEQKFDLSDIHPGCYGTADAVVYDPELKLLRVYDYKHGKGILVEVENNSQLKYYGLGALLSTKLPCSEVELVIVQPRAEHVNGPVRRWRFSSFDLVEFAADLAQFARATNDPNAPLKSGSHCRFCPAAGICPELSSQALAIAQTEFSPAFSYDPQTLSSTLKKIDTLESYAKSVREFAYSEALQGRCPPGFKLVNKRATRKWVSTEDSIQEFLLKGNFNLKNSDILESSLKSVTQIEKVLGKKTFQERCAGLVALISSGTVLVEETDPRPAAITDAASDFTEIESEDFLP